ncbi:group I intron-associated PD-(D/E)XK endonuclease [Bifidobacterium tibiigranuli]|jgi:hypothetical protein|uniref:group I intron-associated PD-(D/E)XK endonuclease n=2 Tax=Bifidobacterium TaxID=1678 RepID=UPI001386DF56
MPNVRTYSDAKLADAVKRSHSWRGVLRELGLKGTSGRSIISVRNRATALGLDLPLLDESVPKLKTSTQRSYRDPADGCNISINNLSKAAASIAASWYQLAGFDVSLPLEPVRFDLIVTHAATVCRVQVKSTITKERGSWKVFISSTSGGRTSYSPSEIDEFFIVDGDFQLYRIPLREVSGKKALSLNCYLHFQVSMVPLTAD